MRRATKAVLDRKQDIDHSVKAASNGSRSRGGSLPKSVDLRTAAMAQAVRRVADVTRQRGFWP